MFNLPEIEHLGYLVMNRFKLFTTVQGYQPAETDKFYVDYVCQLTNYSDSHCRNYIALFEFDKGQI
ncbi:hypothetical protein VCSRO140_1050 [Vibrio cholerae]|nr:hypothetical protein VCSRO140_1050 [Vibrio cholerae]